ncbi:hypothetical protein CAPTEDRAFT_102796, partial [Capitella teleta]
IVFEWLPNVDRIYKLIMEIYLVRECCEFRMEENLLAKLIFLYRNGSMRFQYTKAKID